MKTKTSVTQHNSMMEFFMEIVEEAVKHQKTDLDKMMSYYIVNLMTEYGRIDKFYPNDENEEDTLVAVLNNAMESDRLERIALYKRIGDYTLFVSGFFHDFLSRSLIDVNYYALIGMTAYNNLAASQIGKQKDFYRNFYEELSNKYIKLVDVLSEVSEKVKICTNQDLLRTYDRWLKTSSERDKQLLRKNGVLPVRMENAFTVN